MGRELEVLEVMRFRSLSGQDELVFGAVPASRLPREFRV